MTIQKHRPTAARAGAVCAGCLLGLLLATPPVHAGATLTTAGDRPALHEAHFELDVHLDGVVARIAAHQTFVNPGSVPEEAVYTFDLPADAAVTDVSIRLADGRGSTAVLVDVQAALAAVPDPAGVAGLGAAPDPGMLRMIARDLPAIHDRSASATATYELRVFPVDPGRTVAVTTHWTAPLRYEDGRLILRIPGRGDAANLVRERVSLRLQPPPGVQGFGAVHGGGTSLDLGPSSNARARTARFTAPPRGDLVIDAQLDFGPGGGRPLALFSTTPIRDDLGALSLAVLMPPPAGTPALAFERLLLIIDVSRSLGTDGVAAAATLADALLAGSPANTQVEAILFDHGTRPVFGAFVANHHDTRKTLAGALRPGALDNGSDLGAALDAARALLRGQPLPVRPGEGFERGGRAPTLVAILSDGMLPVELTARRALDRLGRDLLGEVEILSVILAPDEVPVPDLRDGVLPALAGKTGGRAMAVRFGERDARAATLASELARPAPLTELSLELGPAILDRVELPRVLAPGQGVIAVGLYRGPAPRSVVVTGQRSGMGPGTAEGTALHLAAKRDPALGRAALPLALAGAREDDFLAGGAGSEAQGAGAPQVPGAADLEEARRLLVAAARRAQVVSPYSALVAVDARDRFARDRLALSRTWGPSAFFRLPPPPERMPGHRLPAFAWRAVPERRGEGAARRRTGELDRDIIARLLDQHLTPRARACYEDALRHDPGLAGALTVVVELARGEVQHAEVVRSTFPHASMEACVTRAAYSIEVPRVALGDDPETIGVVRYPLRFRKSRRGSEVQAGEPEPDAPAPGDPLRGRGPLDGIE